VRELKASILTRSKEQDIVGKKPFKYSIPGAWRGGGNSSTAISLSTVSVKFLLHAVSLILLGGI
jgi:hypothetical protein